MSKDFFIMLHTQRGDKAMPIVDENEEVMIYQVSNKMNKSNVRARFTLLYDRNNKNLASRLEKLKEGLSQRAIVTIDEVEMVFNDFQKSD